MPSPSGLCYIRFGATRCDDLSLLLISLSSRYAGITKLLSTYIVVGAFLDKYDLSEVV